MKSQHTYSRTREQLAGVAINAFPVAILFLVLRELGHAYGLFHNVVWVALQVLGPAILAFCTSLATNSCEASGVLSHLMQVGTPLGPLVCLTAGLL
jgi:hypothetical protein